MRELRNAEAANRKRPETLELQKKQLTNAKLKHATVKKCIRIDVWLLSQKK